MAATIDTSWKPLAVPDFGGSSFLQYSTGLRASANDLMQGVVSQHQKEQEMAQAALRDKLANDLAVAKLEQDTQQNKIANTLALAKLVIDDENADEDRANKRAQWEADQEKNLLKLMLQYAGKGSGGSGGSGGIGGIGGIGNILKSVGTRVIDPKVVEASVISRAFWDKFNGSELQKALYEIPGNDGIINGFAYMPQTHQNNLLSLVDKYGNLGYFTGEDKAKIIADATAILTNNKSFDHMVQEAVKHNTLIQQKLNEITNMRGDISLAILMKLLQGNEGESSNNNKDEVILQRNAFGK